MPLPEVATPDVPVPPATKPVLKVAVHHSQVVFCTPEYHRRWRAFIELDSFRVIISITSSRWRAERARIWAGEDEQTTHIPPTFFLSLLRNRKLINVLLVSVIYVAGKGHRPYQLVFQLILFQWSKRENGNFRTRGIFFSNPHSSCKSKGQRFTFVSSFPSRFGVE